MNLKDFDLRIISLNSFIGLCFDTCICTYVSIKVSKYLYNFIKYFIILSKWMDFRLKCYNWIGFFDKNKKRGGKWKDREERRNSLQPLKCIKYSCLLVYVWFSAFIPEDVSQSSFPLSFQDNTAAVGTSSHLSVIFLFL